LQKFQLEGAKVDDFGHDSLLSGRRGRRGKGPTITPYAGYVLRTSLDVGQILENTTQPAW
jgi:hypothetical protein